MDADLPNSNYRLPPELMLRIFSLGETQTRANTYPHLHLSWVCQYWRKIINGYPEFWSAISFTPWKGKEFIREVISRSGEAKLSIFAMLKNQEQFSAFGRLVRTESHRIRLFSLAGIASPIFSSILLGKSFPVLDTLIVNVCLDFSKDMTEGLLEIIQAAENIEYLSLSVYSSPICELIPSLHRLRFLNIRFTGIRAAERFCFCLPFFSNLESLIVLTYHSLTSEAWQSSDLPPSVILPRLISLGIDSYALANHLVAPTLRTFIMEGPLKYQIIEQNRSIFNEYDLSSVTHLTIRIDNIGDSKLVLCIQGSAGSLSCPKGAHSLFAIFENLVIDEDADLRRAVLQPPIPTEPVHFRICVPFIEWVSSGDRSLISVIFSKLHNLEELCIIPDIILHSTPQYPLGQLFVSIKEPIRTCLNDIFENLVSLKLRRLIIRDPHADLVRTIFENLHDHSLPNLNTITFRICRNCSYCLNEYVLENELADFLQNRRNSGCKALRTFEVESAYGYALHEGWTSKAATLGLETLYLPLSIP